jgi:hypothetical protein
MTFKDGSATLGTATLSTANGVTTAIFMTTSLGIGSGQAITAVYSGDPNFTSSTSAALAQTVNQAATTTTLTFSPANPTPGQTVTFTATVAASSPGAGNPTGTVTFKDGSTTIGTGTLSTTGGVTTTSFTTASLSAGTHTITASYGGDASFTGSSGSTTVTNVLPSTTYTLWSTNPAPQTADASDGNSVELGVRFTSSVSGTITGLRFYKGPLNTGTHLADLWSSTGTLLATATFSGETASGWQQVSFSQPVAVTAGTMYVASYHTNVGLYAVDRNYFATAYVSGPLQVPANGGVYTYGPAGTFPRNTFQGSNYWVDVVLSSQAAKATPTITWANPASIVYGTPLGSAQLDATASVPGTFAYTPAAGTILNVGNNQTLSVTFAPTDTTDYTTATATVSINVLPSTTYSLWSGSATPQTADAADGNSVELGVRFTPSISGTITGLRFYKGPLNTGAHVADLWSSTGALLATATFTGETASGWQQVSFSQPVAVTAGTTYVASYHTNVGEYAVDRNYFATAYVSGPLQVPANGGVYGYGPAGTFPSASYQGSNYWVDVVLAPAGTTGSSIWGPSATPQVADANDGNAVELGVQFTPSVSGTITGLKFYKGPLNTGTHVADLWSSSGQLLATATFTGETASGWQQVSFSQPVAVTAGTTYVASYHTNVGEYAVDRNYFNAAYSSGPLQVPANGGVYAYGAAGTFPTSSYQGSNYWVDVVLAPGTTAAVSGSVQPGPVGIASAGHAGPSVPVALGHGVSTDAATLMPLSTPSASTTDPSIGLGAEEPTASAIDALYLGSRPAPAASAASSLSASAIGALDFGSDDPTGPAAGGSPSASDRVVRIRWRR